MSGDLRGWDQGEVSHLFIPAHPRTSPANPLSTVENISVWVWDQIKPALPQLCQIEVYETSDNCVLYGGA
jgi:6-pyruvoyl-tetrahydropterin synthase